MGENSAISLDTAKTVLVPAELYESGVGESGMAEAYLRFNGMTLGADEVAVVSEPQNGAVAIMGVNADVWESIRCKHERGEVCVTSPLLYAVAGTGHGGYGGRARKRELNILLTAENVYIAVWEKGLRMAEVMPDNSGDSILYYMSVLGRRFRLRGFHINVGGERAGTVAEILRRYFTHVRIVEL